MQKGEFVLFISRGKIFIGRLVAKWADKRWTIQPLLDNKNQIKRHEKFLLPVSKIKNVLDITKKI